MNAFSTLVAPGPLRTLAASTLVNNLGNGIFAATSVVYLNQYVGISPAVIGVGLTFAAVAGLLSSLPAGMVADRHDPRVAAAVLATAAGVVSGGYAIIDTAWAFLVVAILFTLLERSSIVARQTLVGVLFTGPQRTTARALLRSVTNVGAAVGTGVAAVVLSLGSENFFKTMFLVNALTFVLAGLLLFRVRAESSDDVLGSQPTSDPGGEAHLAEALVSPAEPVAGRGSVLRDVPYAAVASINALLTVHIVVLEVVLPLWVVNRTDSPTSVVALVLIANTVLVIALQLPVSRRFETVVPALVGLRVSATLISAMFLLLALSGSATAWIAVLLLVLVAAAQTGAEMVQGAASWPLSYDLAPPARIGEYQGFFGVAEQAFQIVAPAGLTLLLITWSGPGPIVLATVYAVIAVVAPMIASSMLRDRVATDPV